MKKPPYENGMQNTLAELLHIIKQRSSCGISAGLNLNQIEQTLLVELIVNRVGYIYSDLSMKQEDIWGVMKNISPWKDKKWSKRTLWGKNTGIGLSFICNG